MCNEIDYHIKYYTGNYDDIVRAKYKMILELKVEFRFGYFLHYYSNINSLHIYYNKGKI